MQIVYLFEKKTPKTSVCQLLSLPRECWMLRVILIIAVNSFCFTDGVAAYNYRWCYNPWWWWGGGVGGVGGERWLYKTSKENWSWLNWMMLVIAILLLMLSMLDNSFSRWHFEIFLFFPENMIWHFMQIFSLRDDLHDMSDPILGEKMR